MRHLPSTMALQAFEAAARNLSFLAAAQELSVTPGAISRQIQALENQLSTRLFIRHHKKVALTDRGREFLEDIRGPLGQIAAAAERLRKGPDDKAISIVAYPTFAIRWFIPRWSRFYDAHPDIDIRLTTSLNPGDFQRGSYDAAIRIHREDEADAGLITRELVPIDLYPVASPALARRIRKPADLAGVTLLHSAPRRHDWQRWLQSAGVEGVDARRGPRFESLNLAFQAALEGVGVAIAIGALVQEDLDQGRLVRVFDHARRSSRAMELAYPSTRAASPKLAALVDWLLAEARPASSPPRRASPRLPHRHVRIRSKV